MRALFIGRFQPIHLGHIEIIKKILDEFDEVIVLVAAAQLSHSFKNPLTAGERLTLIRSSLLEHSVDLRRVWIIPAQDVSDNALWVHHLRRLTPKFDVMFSNNPFTLRLFEEAGIETRRTPMVSRQEYSATRIREAISRGEDITGLVASSTIEFLSEWDIHGRYRSIVETDIPMSTHHAGSEMNKE